MNVKEIRNYWENTIAESRFDEDAYNLVEIKTIDSLVHSDWLTFTGLNGDLVTGLLLRPTKIYQPLPAICMFHGYKKDAANESAEDLFKDLVEMAKKYVHDGFVVLIMFSRGQSRQSVDSHGFSKYHLGHLYLKDVLSEDIKDLYCRALFSDAAKCARILMKMKDVDSSAVSVVGYSQGGDIAIACGALEPRISKIICGGIALLDHEQIVRDAHESKPQSLLGQLLNRYFCDCDPDYNSESIIKNNLKCIDLLYLGEMVKQKVLYVMREADPICLSVDQWKFFDSLNTEKNILVFEGEGHLLPNDFFLKVAQILLNDGFPYIR